MMSLLEIENLVVSFPTENGAAHALNEVSLKIETGETLGLVGESGSGKSLTALAILQLIQKPGKIESGKILWKGKNLLDLSPKEMQKVRGKQIAQIFQEPMTALNPVLTVQTQLTEVLDQHFPELSKKEKHQRVVEILKQVGIPNGEERLKNYPHQFSGGMRQRVMIAIALLGEPELLLADEPTTALDVTIQAQILKLLRDIQSARKLSVLFISHDLGVISENCKNTAIMYGGKIVEQGLTTDIFYSPMHPYTFGLIESIPGTQKKDRLKAIRGSVPQLGQFPSGCAFQNRCDFAQNACQNLPNLSARQGQHQVRCHFPIKSEQSA